MKHYTVSYWHRGCQTNTTVTVNEAGFGVINENARTVFLRGQCHALALAIQELTGWPIKGLGNSYDGDAPDSPAHCVVWCPNLKAYVDIRGKVSRSYYRRERGWRLINRNVAPKQAKNFREYLKPNMKVARLFAKAILRDLEAEFSTGTPKK